MERPRAAVFRHFTEARITLRRAGDMAEKL